MSCSQENKKYPAATATESTQRKRGHKSVWASCGHQRPIHPPTTLPSVPIQPPSPSQAPSHPITSHHIPPYLRIGSARACELVAHELAQECGPKSIPNTFDTLEHPMTQRPTPKQKKEGRRSRASWQPSWQCLPRPRS